MQIGSLRNLAYHVISYNVYPKEIMVVQKFAFITVLEKVAEDLYIVI